MTKTGSPARDRTQPNRDCSRSALSVSPFPCYHLRHPLLQVPALGAFCSLSHPCSPSLLDHRSSVQCPPRASASNFVIGVQVHGRWNRTWDTPSARMACQVRSSTRPVPSCSHSEKPASKSRRREGRTHEAHSRGGHVGRLWDSARLPEGVYRPPAIRPPPHLSGSRRRGRRFRSSAGAHAGLR